MTISVLYYKLFNLSQRANLKGLGDSESYLLNSENKKFVNWHLQGSPAEANHFTSVQFVSYPVDTQSLST